MSARVVLAAVARRRLIELRADFASRGRERQAIALIAEILRALARLERHPELGQREPHLVQERKDHRYIVVDGRYKVIYYFAVDEGSTVGVVRVTDIFDARQDPSRMVG